MRTVRLGRAAAVNPHPRPASHRVPRCPASTATGRAIRTAAARMSRHNVLSRLTTTIAVIRSSRTLTIRRPRARTRSREPIPPLAAAIRLRLAPTPHRPIPLPAAVIAAAEVAAADIAVEVAEAVAIAVAVRIVVELAEVHTAVVAVHIVAAVAEVHMAVEGPALTAGTNLVLKFKGPLAKTGRAFCFSACTAIEILSASHPTCSTIPGTTPTQLFPPAGVR